MRKLKKLLSHLFPALCAVALTACGIPKTAATAEVTVVENSGTVLLVIMDGKGAGGAMTVGTGHPIYDEKGEEISADALQPGMQLEVGFDGSVLSTYPGQFSRCEYLKLTGETADITGLAAELEEFLPKPDESDPMPVLQVECMGKQVTSCMNASRGTSSWIDGDEAMLMDSPHPLQWKEENLQAVNIPDGCKKMRLILSKESENLTVRRWELSDLGDTSAEEDLLTPDKDGTLALKAGVYEVEAGYTEGTLTWVFMVE
ncbi:MAG: hypothetical protein IKM31_01420 [Oscillospiraceae bacterium]|nr:hypothetical protein [Oscillospiraceae bacterium]